jgi:hypothetical protein
VRLRAHPNVIDMAAWRRMRGANEAVSISLCAPPGCFVDWQPGPSPPSHPSAQALLAGLMQGIGERERDDAMLDAGRRLAQAATRVLPRPPQTWWRRWLGRRVSRIG